jgi:polysaccharide biosynthesis protein PslG
MVRCSKLVLVSTLFTASALALTACGGAANPTPTSAAPSVAPSIAADAVQPTLVGMHIEGVEAEAWASAPFGALRLWDNGTAWSQIELEKGKYKWDNLEGALNNAEAKGMKDIMMVLGTTPEWAARDITDSVYPPYPGANSAPKDFSDWDNWVTAVVSRYKGRITSYEIWNEANLADFFSGTPEEMAELTARAYKIIKDIDPEATVVSASPALRLTKAFDKFYPAYLKALAAKDWPIDVLAIHTYPTGEGDPVARGVLIGIVKKAITAAGAPADMPLWDTELNYGLAGPGPIPKTEITGAKAAGWVVRTYLDDLRYGIARSYWYIWSLRKIDLLGIQAFPGTDAEQGFFALENWVIGSSFDGCDEAGGAVTCNFSRDGQKSVVAWAQTGEATYTAPAGTQLVCDPLANCQESAADAQITLTEVPVRIYLQ